MSSANLPSSSVYAACEKALADIRIYRDQEEALMISWVRKFRFRWFKRVELTDGERRDEASSTHFWRVSSQFKDNRVKAIIKLQHLCVVADTVSVSSEDFSLISDVYSSNRIKAEL